MPTLDRPIEEILESRSDSPSVREIDGELFQWGFQNWNRLRDFESDDEFLECSSEPHLIFGLGSQRRARRLAQAGDGHRLYEPDPARLWMFLNAYPDLIARNNWKVGCGLWLEDGFFDGLEQSVVHPFVNRLYDPLPKRMIDSQEVLTTPSTLIVQVGALFYRDVLESFKRLDQVVWPIELSHWTPEGLREQFQPDCVDTLFSINLIEDLPRFCAETETRYRCWEIDPSTSPYDDVDESSAGVTHVFTYRKANCSLLEEAGYRTYAYCPLASNPVLRRPLEDVDTERYGTEISFVGSSMRSNAREQLNRLRRYLDDQSESDTNWPRFREWLDGWVETRPAWGEDSLSTVEDRLDDLELPPVVEYDGDPVSLPMVAAEYRAYQKRADVVETVGDQFPIDVWGDSGWVDHVGEHGTYRGEAGHAEELTSIYNASSINLDINRIYQPNIITMRVFDVMACESLVLSERCEAIEELLSEGTDCELYDSPDDLLETIEALLEDEGHRRRVGEQARESVLRGHSIVHRLRAMDLPFNRS